VGAAAVTAVCSAVMLPNVRGFSCDRPRGRVDYRLHSSEPGAPGITEEARRPEAVQHAGIRGSERGGTGTPLRTAYRSRPASGRQR
jgi:hypothetical protein